MREGKLDFVPFYELYINPEVTEAALGKPLADPVAAVEFYYRAGYDFVPFWAPLNMVLGSLVDTSCDYPIKDRKTFDAYPWPDPETFDYTTFDAIGRALPDGMLMVGQIFGVFEIAEHLMGYPGLCYAMADDPGMVEAVFEHLWVIYESMYTRMSNSATVGAVVVSDDLGFKTQTLVSPAYLRRYVLPLHKKLAAIIHAAGKPALMHSCGQSKA